MIILYDKGDVRKAIADFDNAIALNNKLRMPIIIAAWQTSAKEIKIGHLMILP